MPTDNILAPGKDAIATVIGEGVLPREANAGLVFDRYLPLWQGTDGTPRRGQLLEPLQGFVDDFNSRSSDDLAQWLVSMQQRLDRALPRDRVQRVEYRTLARLATGMVRSPYR